MSYTTENTDSVALIPVSIQTLSKTLNEHSKTVSSWVESSGFKAKPNEFCMVPDSTGKIAMVLVGIDENINQESGIAIWAIAGLPKKLPLGQYQLVCDWSDSEKLQATIGWGLGSYSFDFFKQEFLEVTPKPILKVNEDQLHHINAYVDAFTLVRDLVNTPANHMMPQHMSELASVSQFPCFSFTSLKKWKVVPLNPSRWGFMYGSEY